MSILDEKKVVMPMEGLAWASESPQGRLGSVDLTLTFMFLRAEMGERHPGFQQQYSWVWSFGEALGTILHRIVENYFIL